MSRIRTFILTLLVSGLSLLLTACGETPVKPESIIASPPAWYLSPPPDTPQELFGVGAGSSRQSARQSALNDLASKLGVKVSSQFEVQRKTNSVYRYSKETSDKKILTEVQSVTLNQYQVVQTKQIAYDRFFALVKTDKHTLAQAINSNLSAQVSDFIRLEKIKIQPNQLGYLTWRFYNQQVSKLPAFERQLAILKTLNNHSDTSTYQSFLQNTQNKLARSANTVIFYLQATTQVEKVLQAELKNQITASGFRLTNSPLKSTDQIQLQATQKFTQAYGFTIVRSQLELTFSEHNQQRGSSQFTLKGQGLNPQQAMIKLQQDFKQQLANQPFGTTLGVSK